MGAAPVAGEADRAQQTPSRIDAVRRAGPSDADTNELTQKQVQGVHGAIDTNWQRETDRQCERTMSADQVHPQDAATTNQARRTGRSIGEGDR